MTGSRARDIREQGVAAAFVELADTLVDDYDVVDMLDRLVGHAVALLEAEAAGILLGNSRRELQVMACSSEAAELMELLQLQNEQGPCLDCFQNASPVSVPDLAAQAQRWPRFVAAVAQVGTFRSVHALPLRLRRESIGAMGLFHRTAGPLPEADLALGQALADAATIGILHERAVRRGDVVTEQLQSALTSRVVIEQAKGVLAQHTGLEMSDTFELLRGYARVRGLRLALVARRLVERELDPAELAAAGASTPPRRQRGGG
jgi:hypothetical protein